MLASCIHIAGTLNFMLPNYCIELNSFSCLQGEGKGECIYILGLLNADGGCLPSVAYFFVFSYSRHSYIADYSQGGTLPDGTPCWKDFSQSRNNRFLTAEGTSKNRIVAPAKILHFYNGPPDSSDDTVREVSMQYFSFISKGFVVWLKGVTLINATL